MSPVPRLTRIAHVLRAADRGPVDADALAAQLGSTPQQVRRDLRDLREAGALEIPPDPLPAWGG